MFDEEKENWPFYRKKLESYIARLGLALLLDEVHGGNIPKDTEAVPSTDPTKENQKAAGILLNLIYTTTEKGQAAFHIIEKYHESATGYAGGHFYREWQALIRKFEVVKVETLTDLKKEYHNSKMSKNEEPSLFIVKMERLKIKLERKKCKRVSWKSMFAFPLDQIPKKKTTVYPMNSLIVSNWLQALIVKKRITAE
jgi:hypothetical protein